MVIASLLSAACMAMGFRVFTLSTLTPLDNMGVMTMKMMSSTNITSTMGVTLISATGGNALNFFNSIFIVLSLGSAGVGTRFRGSPFNQLARAFVTGREPVRPRSCLLTSRLLPCAGAALRPLQEVVDQLGAGVPHFHVEGFDLVREIVEHPHSRHSHKQS